MAKFSEVLVRDPEERPYSARRPTWEELRVYELFKTIHVIAAVTWVGGVILSQVYAAVAFRSGDKARILGFMRVQGWLGQRFFAPAAGAVVLAGIAMVIESGWEFKNLWIVIGIAIFLISTVIGAGFLTPKSEQLAAALEQKSMDDPEVQRLSGQLALLSRVDFVLLLLVVIDMVVKPGV